jgi:hypothetical protein
MIKNLLNLMTILLILAGCGEVKIPSPIYPNIPVDKLQLSIFSNWFNQTTNQPFDLSSYSLRVQASADLIVHCDGTNSDQADTNGVLANNVLFEGTTSAGIIQFGSLKFVGASNSSCQSFNKATLTYVVNSENSSVKICSDSNKCQLLNLVQSLGALQE